MMMASRGGGVKLASSMMLVSRSFSTAFSRGIIAKEAVTAKAVGFHGDVVRKNIGEFWPVRGSVFGVRHGSTMSFGEKDQQKVEMKQTQPVAEGGDKEEKKEIASYWGVPPSRVTKEDGAEWKWNCFRVRLLISLNISLLFYWGVPPSKVLVSRIKVAFLVKKFSSLFIWKLFVLVRVV